MTHGRLGARGPVGSSWWCSTMQLPSSRVSTVRARVPPSSACSRRGAPSLPAELQQIAAVFAATSDVALARRPGHAAAFAPRLYLLDGDGRVLRFAAISPIEQVGNVTTGHELRHHDGAAIYLQPTIGAICLVQVRSPTANVGSGAILERRE